MSNLAICHGFLARSTQMENTIMNNINEESFIIDVISLLVIRTSAKSQLHCQVYFVSEFCSDLTLEFVFYKDISLCPGLGQTSSPHFLILSMSCLG